MNVEIGAVAAQFPEKEYINGIAVAMYGPLLMVSIKNGFSLPFDLYHFWPISVLISD